ncbi:hypothetical protein GCM10010372_22500 [Streptomyces tauricus]|nr:hypothetical protein GCM10010372_22500 [Streptomyces tauricus]
MEGEADEAAEGDVAESGDSSFPRRASDSPSIPSSADFEGEGEGEGSDWSGLSSAASGDLSEPAELFALDAAGVPPLTASAAADNTARAATPHNSGPFPPPPPPPPEPLRRRRDLAVGDGLVARRLIMVMSIKSEYARCWVLAQRITKP